MPLQYQLIPTKDIARGIDQRSAESNIADGYAEDLINVSANSSGELEKRVGYQGVAGYVPWRVKQVSHEGFQINFRLDDDVDLSGVASSPLLVYGKLPSSESGDFSTTAVLKDYATFSVDVRDLFTNTVTTASKTSTVTGVTSDDLFVWAMESTSSTDADNEAMIADSVTIDSSLTVTVDYTPPVSDRVYISVTDKAATAGTSYVADYTASGTGAISQTITAATHGLSNYNIIAKCYTLSGGTYTEFIPDTLSYNDTTGDVTVTWTAVSSTDWKVVLAAATADHASQLSVNAGATDTITISDIDTNFPYWALYQLNGSTWESVIPDSVVVDDSANTLTVSIVNASASAKTYKFFYDFATIRANTVRVVDTGSTTAVTYTGTTITDPQLTIWGINHSGGHTDDGGEVTHLDAYKSASESRAVCGMAGNLFASRTRSEIGTTYQLPILYTDLDARLASSVSMAPLFQVTGTSASVRTRGIITGDNVSGGYAVVTAAAYVSSGVVDYTLSLTSKSGTLSLASQIATTDYLTVSGLAHAEHTGSFKVVSVPTQDSSSVTIRVSNSAVTTADYDESGAAGSANVFTDNFTISSSTTFYIPGDVIQSDSIDSDLTLTVKSQSSTTVTVSGVTETISLASGLAVYGKRTGYVQPLRNTAATAAVRYLVKGDMVTLANYEGDTMVRQPRVVSINPFQTQSVTIAVASGTATVTTSTAAVTGVSFAADTITCSGGHGLATNDPFRVATTDTLLANMRDDITYFASVQNSTTFQVLPKEDGTAFAAISGNSSGKTVERVHGLSVGQRFTIGGTGDPLLDGTFTVVSVPNNYTFTYTTTSTTASASGYLIGRTVEFDESLTFTDSLATPTSVTVSERWIPIEATSPAGDLPPTTYVSHFDATSSRIRSCIVGGNMYLANQSDEVMKFDGTSLYQAGLFRWQPQCFASYVVDGGDALTLDGVVATLSTSSGNKFTVGAGEATQFAVGDRIVHYGASANATYTVQSVDTTNNFVYVSESSITTGTTGTLKKVKTYRYYFRLNLIDANNNVIASAATGYKDIIVELANTGEIRLRLVGMPVWGNYDYDRIELDVYRTAADTVAPYYKIRSLPITFSDGYNYIDVYDGTTDEVLLASGSLDTTMTALVGAELGTAWEQPPRAKYVTAVNNRLVLGNLKDYQQLDFTVRKQANAASVTAANLSGFTWTFRKDSTDASSTTNMTDRVTYEFVTSGAVAINPASDISSTSTTFTVTSAAHGLAVGNWVYLFHNHSGGENSHLDYSGWFQVTSKDTNTFTCKLASTHAAVSSFTFVDGDVNTGADTITETNHGLTNGARVKLSTTGVLPAGLSSATTYYVVGATTSTFQLSTSFGGSAVNITGAAGGGTHTVSYSYEVDSYVCATTKTNVPVWLGSDNNYNFKYGNTSGSYEAIAMRRLGAAINASMVAADTSVSGQTAFVPWLTANAGGEYAPGQLVVRQPKYSSTTMEVALGTLGSNYDVFVNNVKRASSAQISATTLLFPSRVAISYENYPETFDNPAGAQSDSDSVVDVNSADGEEITGLIPFFGESAFGQSQVESLVVVFKTNSVYLLDVRTRSVQKIDSQGLGCTAPYSISATRNGIMFANLSGVYRLNRNLTVSYVGKFIERYWKDDVNADQLALATGHNYGIGRQYKLSVPIDDDDTNSVVLVYDHTREGQDQEFGAWTRYTNHDVTGWANLDDDSFFATNDGQVFKIRRANDETDYRDDDSAVAEMVMLLKPMDAGMPGVRKACRNVVLQSRMSKSDITGTDVYAAVDLNTTFESAGTVEAELGDKKVETYRVSLPTPRFDYLQVKLTNDVKDEHFALAGVGLLVAPLTQRGVTELADLAS